MDPQRAEVLVHKIDRANSAIRYSLVGLVVVMFVMLIVVVIQLFAIQRQIQTTLQTNQKSGAANHRRTQQYIRCVAETLLVPLQDRGSVNFDNCANSADGKPDTESAAGASS